MSKLVEVVVEKCIDCPYIMERATWICGISYDAPSQRGLGKKSGVIGDIDVLPDWCPLPDVKERV